MKAIICDRCKNVFTESNYAEVEIVINRGIKVSAHKFDLCKDCKNWFYKELGVKKEEWE